MYLFSTDLSFLAEVVDVLLHLHTKQGWEIRQSAMLVLQYIIAVRKVGCLTIVFFKVLMKQSKTYFIVAVVAQTVGIHSSKNYCCMIKGLNFAWCSLKRSYHSHLANFATNLRWRIVLQGSVGRNVAPLLHSQHVFNQNLR